MKRWVIFFLLGGVCLHAEEPLSLKKAIQETIVNQPAIQISEAQVKIQQGLWEQATGAFNPSLSAGFSQLLQSQMQTYGVRTGLRGHTNKASAALEGKNRFGTSVGLSYNNTQTIDPINIPLVIPRLDGSAIGFSITQPLLRDFIYSQSTMAEMSAQMSFRASELKNVQNVASALNTTIASYWNLVGAERLRVVQVQMVNLLSRILEYAEALVEEKQQGPATLHQPIAQLALAKQGLYQAEEQVRSSYYTLLFNMGLNPTGLEEVPPFSFEEFPDSLSFPPLSKDWYDIYSQQMKQIRPDIVGARFEIDSADKLLSGAKNALLPYVNFSFSGTYTNTLNSQRAHHFSSTTHFNDPQKDLTIGVSFSYPLFNDVAKGDVMRKRAVKSQAIATYQNLIIQARTQLETVFTLNNSLLDQLNKARLSENEYAKTVETELVKLKDGLSDYFVVLQLQQDWLNTVQTRINLEIQFAQNLSQLRLITGTLIRWEDLSLCYQVENPTEYPELLLGWKPYEFTKCGW